MRKRGTSALQAQARLMVIRGNPSVAQPATAGIQTSKPLSTILMMYLRHCCDYHAPAVAYHSWCLAVATALSPRMVVLCPLMQINRQQRAIEDMNPKSLRCAVDARITILVAGIDIRVSPVATSSDSYNVSHLSAPLRWCIGSM
jgi:hypothetical protein